ncbi:HAMP domain-containing protein, partial [Enterobacter hormaechei subsp. xiangfangensis]
MSNDTFNTRQQEILLKAGVLSLFALLLTFLLARRLARRLAQPLSAMGQALERIQSGDYRPSLVERGNDELTDLAR